MPTAVITGASRGLGRAIARVLAEEGHDLALGARSVSELEELATDLPVDVLVHPVDVTDRAHVVRFRDAVIDQFGAVDVLVANAGIGTFEPIATFDAHRFDQLFAVNVRGVFLSLQAFTPSLQEAASGLAVVVSSDVSTRVFPGGGPYCATKHAVRTIARAWQQEHPDLRLLELRPGSTDTAFADTVEGDAGPGVLTAAEVAEVVRSAVRLPGHVRLEEVVVRSTGQDPVY